MNSVTPYKFSKLIFPSNHRGRLVSFLGDILEAEIEVSEVASILNFGELSIEVVDAQKNQSSFAREIFEFRVSPSEFSEISKRLDFFMYRYKELGGKGEVKRNDDGLSFSDDDGRTWRFQIAVACGSL